MLLRVSEKGTLQLSIDADSVRRLLLEFPKAARPLDDPSEFASYAHHVEREMGGAINLVKVLQVRTQLGGAPVVRTARPSRFAKCGFGCVCVCQRWAALSLHCSR